MSIRGSYLELGQWWYGATVSEDHWKDGAVEEGIGEQKIDGVGAEDSSFEPDGGGDEETCGM